MIARNENQGVEVRVPKVTGIQNGMVALEQAIADNIVGITDDLAQQHLKYHVDVKTGITVVSYKGNPILRCGFRESSVGSPNGEFYIESCGAVSA